MSIEMEQRPGGDQVETRKPTTEELAVAKNIAALALIEEFGSLQAALPYELARLNLTYREAL